MTYEFSVDLKAARKKAGLSQKDCAHLLEIDPSRVSQLENGKAKPSVLELATFSIVYGRTLQSMAHGLFDDIIKAIPERLSTMPMEAKDWLPKFNRTNTLNKLAARIQTLNRLDYGVV